MASQWWKARKRQKCGIYAPPGRKVWTFIIAQITICYTRTFLRGTYYVTLANWSGSMVHSRGGIGICVLVVVLRRLISYAKNRARKEVPPR